MPSPSFTPAGAPQCFLSTSYALDATLSADVVPVIMEIPPGLCPRTDEYVCVSVCVCVLWYTKKAANK